MNDKEKIKAAVSKMKGSKGYGKKLGGGNKPQIYDKNDGEYVDFKKGNVSNAIKNHLKNKKISAPKVEISADYKVSNMIDANKYAKEANAFIDKYTVIPSKWSGKIEIDPQKCNKYKAIALKDWNCDVVIKGEVEKKVIIHELLHARSSSLYAPIEYMQNERAEEGAVEFLAQEIAKREGLTFNGSYSKLTKHLEIIQSTTKLWKSNYDLAIEFYNVPMPNRGDWINKKVQSFLATDKSLSEVERRNLTIHGNSFYGRI